MKAVYISEPGTSSERDGGRPSRGSVGLPTGDRGVRLACLASPDLISCELRHSAQVSSGGCKQHAGVVWVSQEEERPAVCLVLRHRDPGVEVQGVELSSHCFLYGTLDTCVGQSAVGDQGPRGAETLEPYPICEVRKAPRGGVWLWGLVLYTQ